MAQARDEGTTETLRSGFAYPNCQIAVKVHKIIYCLRFIHIGFLLVSRNYFASIQLIFQDMVIYRQYQFMDSC